MSDILKDFDFDFYGLENRLEGILEDYIDDLKLRVKEVVAKSILPLPTSEYSAIAATNEFWVSRGCAGIEGRPYLRYMRARVGEIEATNGHFLLRAKTAMDDGFYLPTPNTIEKSFDMVNYPNTDKVVPEHKNWADLSTAPDGDRLKVNGGTIVNKDYLHLITEGKESDWEIAFDEKSTRSPLLLRRKDGERWAVLMPLMR